MIGIFDSGLGGLTALTELRRHRPDIDIHYYADTAHLPYGTRSSDTLYRLSRAAIAYLIKCGADAVLVACGTVSSVVLPRLQSEFATPLIGVVEPAVHAALHYTRNNIVGILGTEATVRSRAFERALRERAPIATLSVACPLFVSLVENGFTSPNDPIATSAISHYLSPLRDKQIDTLILGCTHFPHLAAGISAYLPGVRLIGAGEAAADAIVATRPRVGHGKLTIEVSDAPDTFARTASRLMGISPLHVQLKR